MRGHVKQHRPHSKRPPNTRESAPKGDRPSLRLIDYLRALPLTNREARSLLETGKVFYKGIPTADPGRAIDAADVLIKRDAPRLRPNRDLAIIHRDKHMVVVYKPPGMLAVSATGRRNTKNVIGVVRHLLGTALPVHRLDEFTSGLMMVALTEECQLRIKEILFHHRVERRYLALVSGHFPEEACTVRSMMVRNRGDGLRGSSTDEDAASARESVTHFSLREHLGRNASLVEARLETGRTHQVRIHLHEKGFPILGDDLYAPTGISRAAPRLALHATSLEIKHPFTGKLLALEAPLADDLEALRRFLLRREEERTTPRTPMHRTPRVKKKHR